MYTLHAFARTEITTSVLFFRSADTMLDGRESHPFLQLATPPFPFWSTSLEDDLELFINSSALFQAKSCDFLSVSRGLYLQWSISHIHQEALTACPRGYYLAAQIAYNNSYGCEDPTTQSATEFGLLKCVTHFWSFYNIRQLREFLSLKYTDILIHAFLNYCFRDSGSGL